MNTTALLKYLKKNWRHLSAGLIAAILQILSMSGAITPAIANIASILAVALGLSTTTNSGTTAPPSVN